MKKPTSKSASAHVMTSEVVRLFFAVVDCGFRTIGVEDETLNAHLVSHDVRNSAWKANFVALRIDGGAWSADRRDEFIGKLRHGHSQCDLARNQPEGSDRARGE